MDLKVFLSDRVVGAQTEKVIISKRFQDEEGNPVPFEIKPISEAQSAELRKASQFSTTQKGGIKMPQTDSDRYLAKLAVACTIFPDFCNAQLQASWGVLGSEDLVRKMLLAGEFAALMEHIQRICGFDEDVNEVKEN